MQSEIKKLNRFTTLPFVTDLLLRKKLTLLNPEFWEDYNDRATLEIFRKNSNAESVYALCLTYQNETIHHWNAFANGTSGCCIEFSPERLFTLLGKIDEVNHGKAQYIKVGDLKKHNFENEQLPYLKREPFKPENEYRIIAMSNQPQKPAFDIDIDLSIIRRITISNKIPESVFESNKKVLLQIAPELKGKIFHSTLYRNSTWINHFNK